jgi:hypothetical protein
VVRPPDARLGADGEQALGPAPGEVGLLLEMGKLAAEAGPQRLYALLTGFAVGRALGRAERDDATLDARAFLQKALEDARAVAASSESSLKEGAGPLRSCCGVISAIQPRREARRMHGGLVEPALNRRPAARAALAERWSNAATACRG